MQIIAANSQYPQHKRITCKKQYVPIAYAPQESTGVQNALVIILPVLKTIFQNTLLKTPKNGVPMLINNF